MNRRKFGRFETHLEAQYKVQGSERKWQKCTVRNMSRKGIGIHFHSPAKMSTGTPIRLEIFIPDKQKPIGVEGVLRWTDRRKDGNFGGMECNEILDEMRFSKLA